MLDETVAQEDMQKLKNDPDFILIKRFDFSLRRMLERKPSGVSDRTVAQALGIQEEEVNPLFQGVLKKLKVLLK